jgi:hypothetical protein
VQRLPVRFVLNNEVNDEPGPCLTPLAPLLEAMPSTDPRGVKRKHSFLSTVRTIKSSYCRLMELSYRKMTVRRL